MPTYIYARVSTLEQATTGSSIEGQVLSALSYCEQQGLVLGEATNCGKPGVFVDGGHSAFKKPLASRPGGRALSAVLRPFDTVVCTAVNRLFRRMPDMINTAEAWTQAHVHMRFLDYPTLRFDDVGGKAMLSMIGVMAQMKSELISARVRESRKGGAKKAPPTSFVKGPQLPLGSGVGRVLVEMHKPVPAGQKQQRVLAYVRVSTDEQTVEHQRALLSQRCGDISAFFVDEGTSAFKTPLPKREAGFRLLAALQPGDVVAVWRADRLFRSMQDAANQMQAIHKKGASIWVVESGMRTSDVYGEMMLSALTMMAQMESQETSRSMRHAALASIAAGGACRDQYLPKVLRPIQQEPRQTAYAFDDVMSPKDRYDLWMKYLLLRKQYRDDRSAARAVCSDWLSSQGLPLVFGTTGDTVVEYRNRLKGDGPVVEAVRQSLAKLPDGEWVRHPINMQSLGRATKKLLAFLETARKLPGSVRENVDVAMLAKDGDTELMSKIIRVLRGAENPAPRN